MAKEYGINGQTDRRRTIRPTDQHGRRFWGTAEAGQHGVFPVGPLYPDGWQAPWLPDMKYYTPDAENPTRFRWDYETLATDLEQAHEEYHQQALKLAIAREWPIPEKGKPYLAQIVAVIGEPPKPVEPVYAAMDGNSWILGRSATPDPRLAPFIKPRRRGLRTDRPSFRDEDASAPVTRRVEATVDTPTDDLDVLLDLEEQHDRDAVGGKRVKVGRK